MLVPEVFEGSSMVLRFQQLYDCMMSVPTARSCSNWILANKLDDTLPEKQIDMQNHLFVEKHMDFWGVQLPFSQLTQCDDQSFGSGPFYMFFVPFCLGLFLPESISRIVSCESSCWCWATEIRPVWCPSPRTSEHSPWMGRNASTWELVENTNFSISEC